MKKKNLIIVAALLTAILVAGVCIFNACKKNDDINNPSKGPSKLMQFYDASLIESFKNEPIAQEFFQELNRTQINVVNGILSFNNVEELNRVYDLIIDYTDRYDELVCTNSNYSRYAQSEQMPNYIMSFLFESKLGFNSLRADIEEQLLILERGAGIPDNNDPDDHFTVSPYWRTLLTPQCELIIDDLICVYYDTYGIGIMNFDWTTLNELHQYQSKNNFDERKALAFCAGKQNAFFLTTGNEPTLHVDYIFIPDAKNPNVIQFVNYSCSEAYKDMEYLWDFGDGTTSTERNPKHTYKIKGTTVDVCLTVSLPNTVGGSNSKSQTVSCQNMSIPPPLNGPSIVFSDGYEGFTYFSCITTDPDPLNTMYIIWNFGDGSNDYYGSFEESHQYWKNGTYYVTAKVYFTNGTTETASKHIQVKSISGGGGGGNGGGGGGSCCAKSIDIETDKDWEYTYNGEKRRVKQVIRVTNILGFHRIASTTKNQYEKSNGNWAARKVDEINAGAAGIIYWQDDCDDCQCPCQVKVWKGGEITATEKPNKNASEAVMDRGTGGYRFKVGKKTLWSQHYVKDGGTIWMLRPGDVAVHDKSCN